MPEESQLPYDDEVLLSTLKSDLLKSYIAKDTMNEEVQSDKPKSNKESEKSGQKKSKGDSNSLLIQEDFDDIQSLEDPSMDDDDDDIFIDDLDRDEIAQEGKRFKGY